MRNKLRIVKTFEQFKEDNSKAQIDAYKYLLEISANLDKIGYFKLKRETRANILKIENWTIYDSPNSEFENETTEEFETTFENQELKVDIVIVTRITPSFYESWPETQSTPAEYEGEDKIEIESIMLYTENSDNEYNINITSEIEDISTKIINSILNK